MKNKKIYFTIVLTLCMLICNAFTTYAFDIIDSSSCRIGEYGLELQPQAANACKGLDYYFGSNYKVIKDDGTWQYIEGTNGYTGAYNYTTGYGYLINDDGSHTPFFV